MFFYISQESEGSRYRKKKEVEKIMKFANFLFSSFSVTSTFLIYATSRLLKIRKINNIFFEQIIADLVLVDVM